MTEDNSSGQLKCKNFLSSFVLLNYQQLQLTNYFVGVFWTQCDFPTDRKIGLK